MSVIDFFGGNEYFKALFILSFFILFSKAFVYITEKYIKKIAEKTKTNIDDFIINSLKSPAYFFIMTIGIYFSLNSLSILQNYEKLIKGSFFIVIVIIITIITVRMVDALILKWLKVNKKFEKTPKLINRIINIVIYIIALLIILEHFNIKITPIIATLGVGALAVGLALQNTLSNFFAGLHIISDKPINVGDFIELQQENISGYVDDIGWRSTRIKTPSNNIVIIPNSRLADSIIINNNLSQVQEISFSVQCGVSYHENLDKVEKITMEVAQKIQNEIHGCIKNFKPFVRYNSFGDSNINFSVIFKTEYYTDRFLVIHEFIKALKKTYDKNKIEISYPVRKVYMTK